LLPLGGSAVYSIPHPQLLTLLLHAAAAAAASNPILLFYCVLNRGQRFTDRYIT